MNYTLDTFAIAASSQGTNARSLIEQAYQCDIKPAIIIVTNEDSPLLKTYPNCLFIDPKKYKGEKFEELFLNSLKDNGVRWLFLAGFYKILSSRFLQNFSNDHFYQVVNIHPSLLPKYPGLGAYKKSYKSNDQYFGHTIHLVNEGVDEGQILYQQKLPNDTSMSFDKYVEKAKKHENKSYAYLLKKMHETGLTVLDDGSVVLNKDDYVD